MIKCATSNINKCSEISLVILVALLSWFEVSLRWPQFDIVSTSCRRLSSCSHPKRHPTDSRYAQRTVGIEQAARSLLHLRDASQDAR